MMASAWQVRIAESGCALIYASLLQFILLLKSPNTCWPMAANLCYQGKCARTHSKSILAGTGHYQVETTTPHSIHSGIYYLSPLHNDSWLFYFLVTKKTSWDYKDAWQNRCGPMEIPEERNARHPLLCHRAQWSVGRPRRKQITELFIHFYWTQYFFFFFKIYQTIFLFKISDFIMSV